MKFHGVGRGEGENLWGKVRWRIKACKSTNSQQIEALKMILAVSSPFCGRIDICFQMILEWSNYSSGLAFLSCHCCEFQWIEFNFVPPRSAPLRPAGFANFRGAGQCCICGMGCGSLFPREARIRGIRWVFFGVPNLCDTYRKLDQVNC